MLSTAKGITKELYKSVNKLKVYRNKCTPVKNKNGIIMCVREEQLERWATVQ